MNTPEDEYEIYEIKVPRLKPAVIEEFDHEYSNVCRCVLCKGHRDYLKIVEDKC